MTTIAYRDGVLAADSQVTAGRDRLGASFKIGRRGQLLYGASGDAAWGWGWRSWVASGMPEQDPPRPDEGTGGFIILPDDTLLFFHSNGWERRHGLPFFADGSGADYALGALQVGATPQEAVAAAAVWDTNTGGAVVVVTRPVRNPKQEDVAWR